MTEIPKEGWAFDFHPRTPDDMRDGIVAVEATDPWEPIPWYSMTMYHDGEPVISMEAKVVHFYTNELHKLSEVMNDMERLRKLGDGPAAQRLDGFLHTWMRDNQAMLSAPAPLPIADMVAVVLNLVHADDPQDPKERLIRRLEDAMKSEMGTFMAAADMAWDHWARAIVAKMGIFPVDSDRLGGIASLYTLEDA